ncbi:hypothetical protein Verru16b_01909 [Lacunisphaera limnophila]|uniref:Uncharacterized protein n=1 Tax=Lacunisphaera limnophila TaxID=1838286 RepID=A0A1D8AVB7_9BACT|nr:hypothetical protein [Lacunisphaera limnophila]AOS44840.1 hypothetical protein Verru16b_01909 [Lacunisphaera limnophila]
MTGEETIVAFSAAAALIPLGLGLFFAGRLRSASYGWLLVLCAVLCGISIHSFYEMLVLNVYPVVMPLVLYSFGWLGASIITGKGYLRWRRQQREKGA